ncbi:hypothetical protein HDU87_001735 [Geranomyces variabilis]|uniref:Uncharacterized protein n=1 Tax=Geranomyces variabilis TaxID=109894 RepID=A0AAD5TBL8_9FUNG|nr:hypothetical protein HDU87_001735 [Geranomyces variabilis]
MLGFGLRNINILSRNGADPVASPTVDVDVRPVINVPPTFELNPTFNIHPPIEQNAPTFNLYHILTATSMALSVGTAIGCVYKQWRNDNEASFAVRDRFLRYCLFRLNRMDLTSEDRVKRVAQISRSANDVHRMSKLMSQWLGVPAGVFEDDAFTGIAMQQGLLTQ